LEKSLHSSAQKKNVAFNACSLFIDYCYQTSLYKRNFLISFQVEKLIQGFETWTFKKAPVKSPFFVSLNLHLLGKQVFPLLHPHFNLPILFIIKPMMDMANLKVLI